MGSTRSCFVPGRPCCPGLPCSGASKPQAPTCSLGIEHRLPPYPPLCCYPTLVLLLNFLMGFYLVLTGPCDPGGLASPYTPLRPKPRTAGWPVAPQPSHTHPSTLCPPEWAASVLLPTATGPRVSPSSSKL